ncbi:hypothetical protein CRUP_020566, partial [Coryphaenoides rupestris]
FLNSAVVAFSFFLSLRLDCKASRKVTVAIEILTYCQLTCRQRLLYKALRNKISIEDLLQSSMGTAQQAHSTTSSLMNLVMQFRKETRSPFHMALKPYIMSKFLYRQGLVHAHDQAKKNVLVSKDGGSCFSFLRFVDVSPAEMSNVMLRGTLDRCAANVGQLRVRGSGWRGSGVPTFLNCMTRFMREEVVLWACWAVPMDDCSRSSMEILFLSAL